MKMNKHVQTGGIMAMALILPMIFLSAADKKAAPSGNDVKLVDLEPSEIEWGTYKENDEAAHGPRVVDWGSAGNMGAMWAGGAETKVVKAYDKKFSLPEGKIYASDMSDCFAVGGEFMTGVGLWSRRRNFYHWLEYKIPAGSKVFKANLYVTDDPRGYQWWAGANMQFTIKVFIDGKEVFELTRTRGNLEHGSGELMENISVPIPAGAKAIRFQVANSAWGDGNSNTELLLNEAVFQTK